MSTINVNAIDKESGSTLTLGTSGTTVDIPSGATLDATGATITGFPEGGLQLITSATNNSSVANWDFTDCFSATYSNYLVTINGMICPVNQELRVSIGTSDLSSLQSFNYVMWQTNMSGSTTYRATSGTTVTYVDLNNTSSASEPTDVQMVIHNPFSSSLDTKITGQSTYYANNSTYSHGLIGAMTHPAASGASMRFSSGSGNIGSSSYTARVSIYGLAES